MKYDTDYNGFQKRKDWPLDQYVTEQPENDTSYDWEYVFLGDEGRLISSITLPKPIYTLEDGPVSTMEFCPTAVMEPWYE